MADISKLEQQAVELDQETIDKDEWIIANYENYIKNGCNNIEKDLLDLAKRQKAEIINRTEEYNDMLEQRNKVEEALEIMTMDVNSLTSERDALNEMVIEQKAALAKKDTEINILIRKKESLRDEISELKAEIERLQGFYKPTETSGYKIENGKVIFYTNMLNGYRHEYENLDEVVKELNMMLQRCYLYDDSVGYFKSKIKELRTAKSEVAKEFAERFKKKAKVEIYCDNTLPKPRKIYCIEEDGIDNLVKEITEAIL